MIYGILAFGNCLLTNIVDQLHVKSKKVNSVERLTRHLNKGIPKNAQKSYLSFVCTMVSKNPIIHIDDSDVIKPEDWYFGRICSFFDYSLRNLKEIFISSYPTATLTFLDVYG